MATNTASSGLMVSPIIKATAQAQKVTYSWQDTDMYTIKEAEDWHQVFFDLKRDNKTCVASDGSPAKRTDCGEGHDEYAGHYKFSSYNHEANWSARIQACHNEGGRLFDNIQLDQAELEAICIKSPVLHILTAIWKPANSSTWRNKLTGAEMNITLKAPGDVWLQSRFPYLVGYYCDWLGVKDHRKWLSSQYRGWYSYPIFEDLKEHFVCIM